MARKYRSATRLSSGIEFGAFAIRISSGGEFSDMAQALKDPKSYALNANDRVAHDFRTQVFAEFSRLFPSLSPKDSCNLSLPHHSKLRLTKNGKFKCL